MIPPYLVLAFGVLLVVAELLVGSFFILFFGLGFLVVGILCFFVNFSWYVQILLASILSFIFLIVLKRPIKERFYASKNEVKDDFLNESGEGEIKEGMVYFKGTLWHYDGNLKDGERVFVVGTKGNRVILKDS